MGRALFLVALSLLAACSASKAPTATVDAWKEVRLGEMTDDLSPASLALAASRSAAALEAVAAEDDGFMLGGRRYDRGDLVDSARRVEALAKAADASAKGSSEAGSRELAASLARECRAFASASPAKVTGYYEPLLDARLRPDRRFRFPLYRLPSKEDLARITRRLGHVPARADIDGGDAVVREAGVRSVGSTPGGGALAGLGLELAWVEDPVARFFLHVQGSGRLRLEDGRELRVGFAGTNGLEYRSVGARMLAEGLLEKGRATATDMRAWLAANPGRRDELLFHNPRYVFFRELGGDGPVGSLGAVLVPGRSVAVDPTFVPRGILAFLRAEAPVIGADGAMAAKRRFERFVFAQDTGAAIRGEARVDLYEGSGEEAGRVAGARNDPGDLFLLLCDADRRPPRIPPGPPMRRVRLSPLLRPPR